MNSEAILALMLTLGPAPGRSIYSLVEVPEGSPPACDNENNLLCAEPTWSRYHDAYVRPETKEEAIERYWVIAKAIERATEGKGYLVPFVLAATQHESGWRRDVHSGVGADAKGDQGQSWCLGQIMLGVSGANKIGSIRADELVGLDAQSTRRCIDTVTKRFDQGFKYCTFGGPQPKEQCVFAHYGGRVALFEHKAIKERASTYWRYKSQAPLPLTRETEAIIRVHKESVEVSFLSPAP